MYFFSHAAGQLQQVSMGKVKNMATRGKPCAGKAPPWDIASLRIPKPVLEFLVRLAFPFRLGRSAA